MRNCVCDRCGTATPNAYRLHLPYFEWGKFRSIRAYDLCKDCAIDVQRLVLLSENLEHDENSTTIAVWNAMKRIIMEESPVVYYAVRNAVCTSMTENCLCIEVNDSSLFRALQTERYSNIVNKAVRKIFPNANVIFYKGGNEKCNA